MRRYTINYRFGDSYLPMINCHTLSDVANHLRHDKDGMSFKIYDNVEKKWVEPELVFIAYISNNE